MNGYVLLHLLPHKKYHLKILDYYSSCKQREISIAFSRDAFQFDFESSNSPFPHLHSSNSPFPHLHAPLKSFLLSLSSEGFFCDRIGKICLSQSIRVGTKFKYNKQYSRKIIRTYGGGSYPS